MDSTTLQALRALLGQVDTSVQGVMAQIAMGNYPWWYPDGAKGRQIDYFAYTASWLPLVASTTDTRIIQIDADSAFVILSAVAVETATDNTTFLPQRPLLANLKTLQSGRTLSDNPVHVDNWFGTAEQPNYWDMPKILLPATAMQVQLQNLEATDRNVRLAFRGIKIFQYAPS